jgi:hypothetical protein
MISEARSDGRSLAQLIMRPAQIVGTANQVHPPLKRFQMGTSMTTFASQGCQAFSDRSIEPLDIGSIDLRSPFRLREACCQALFSPTKQVVLDRDQTVFLLRFDHLSNDELRPDLYLCSVFQQTPFDLLGKCTQDGVGVSGPAVDTDEELTRSTRTSADHAQ